MAKYYGNIGFNTPVEIQPGIWEDQMVERPYYGDLIRNTSKSQSSGDVNDDISVNNDISIVADPYANENFQHMKYVTFMGAKWKITLAEVKYPRIILTVGGLYNGK